MYKFNSKVLLTAMLLIFGEVMLQYTRIAEAAQTINGKAIGTVDDVVKEINKGDLSLKKEGLITIRGLTNSDNSYIDLFATTFGKDGTALSKKFGQIPDLPQHLVQTMTRLIISALQYRANCTTAKEL